VTRLVVGTWNIHRCVGRDGREDPDRVACVIGQLDTCAIALQEVDGGAQGGGDQLPMLAEATGLEPIEGPTLRNDRGAYGNALLTSLPIRDVRRLDLSVAGYEPRGALDVTLEACSGRLRVVATHLGLARSERRIQVTRLLTALEGHDGSPLLLLGDLNEWAPRTGTLRLLRTRFERLPARATFPSRRPVLALDRIGASPATLLQAIEVHRSAEARVASDHLPLRGFLNPNVDTDGAV
jgi:endonuclease/exonuclease/phosphatase family metal-dependent hydrolase